MLNLQGIAFPSIIDNTVRSTFRQCPGKYALRHGLGYTPSATNANLNAGGALAKGLEVTRRLYFGGAASEAEAMTRGLEALLTAFGEVNGDVPRNKTLDRMVAAFYSYWDEYGLDTDVLQPLSTPNGPAVEFSFTTPLLLPLGSAHMLQYSGKFDMLAYYRNQIVIVDEKTTGQLGGSWADQWDIDGQITGYIWSLRQMGYAVAGAVIRGIGLYANDIRHVQHFTSRTEHELSLWYQSVQEDVTRLQQATAIGSYSLTLDKAICASYGGCQFRKHCTQPDPVSSLQTAGFVVHHWSPIDITVDPNAQIVP